jgi:hypothetical protein
VILETLGGVPAEGGTPAGDETTADDAAAAFCPCVPVAGCGTAGGLPTFHTIKPTAKTTTTIPTHK